MSPAQIPYSALATGMQVSGALLDFIADVAQLSPIPYVDRLVSLGVSILNAIQQTHDNKESFQQLAKDIRELVLTVVDQKALIKSPETQKTIAELVLVLLDIRKFVDERASYNAFRRLLNSGTDVNKIKGYRAKIRQALDVFGLQVHIRMDENIIEILQTLRKNRLVPQESPTASVSSGSGHTCVESGDENALPGKASPPVAPADRQPPPPPPEPNRAPLSTIGSSNIVNSPTQGMGNFIHSQLYGPITVTNVAGNQNTTYFAGEGAHMCPQVVPVWAAFAASC